MWWRRGARFMRQGRQPMGWQVLNSTLRLPLNDISSRAFMQVCNSHPNPELRLSLMFCLQHQIMESLILHYRPLSQTIHHLGICRKEKMGWLDAGPAEVIGKVLLLIEKNSFCVF